MKISSLKTLSLTIPQPDYMGVTGLLFLALLTLKLSSIAPLSWAWVTSPLWVPRIAEILARCLVILVRCLMCFVWVWKKV